MLVAFCHPVKGEYSSYEFNNFLAADGGSSHSPVESSPETPDETTTEQDTTEEETSEDGTTQEQKMRTLPHQEEVAPFVSGVEKLFSLSGGQSHLCDDDFLLPGLPYDTMTTTDIIDQHSERCQRQWWCKGEHHIDQLLQSCYMNSSLQSLLTLETFVRDISCQEPIWSSVPEAQLIRRFTAIKEVHTSTGPISKKPLLRSFKEEVSGQAPEFSDSEQKDAHEFLTSVLNQMWSLSPMLQNTAACMDRKSTCPVEDHLVFKMENIWRALGLFKSEGGRFLYIFVLSSCAQSAALTVNNWTSKNGVCASSHVAPAWPCDSIEESRDSLQRERQ
ncbi:hypothetical protein ABVT39_014433 [Epinephelus coioides]